MQIQKYHDNATSKNKFTDGLDFILSHFTEPLFPRKYSTAATNGVQIRANNREELITAYEKADLLDCRINAFPVLTESGERQQAPDFLFIDLDRSTFSDSNTHRMALNDTLRNIKRELGAYPTVIWSGNGYHIYLPIQNFVLENVVEFAKFDRPSVQFLRFAEFRLSGGKSDPAHKPSFKSCMIRIPGSYNSKCLANGRMDDVEVRIVHLWNGVRPKVTKELLKEFLNYLTEERIKELKRIQALSEKYGIKESNNNTPQKISWIEALLQTPIADYRKNTIALILAPYLINIRKLSHAESTQIINSWLEKCHNLHRLDSSFRIRIKTALDTAIEQRTKPMKFTTLHERNPGLYSILLAKIEKDDKKEEVAVQS